MSVNVRSAKDQLSSLLEEAALGNEVIITSDGLPKARLVPVRERRKTFRWTGHGSGHNRSPADRPQKN